MTMFIMERKKTTIKRGKNKTTTVVKRGKEGRKSYLQSDDDRKWK